jgi:hypothetical protein
MEAVQSAQTIPVRRVSTSEELLRPGEYVFIAKRPPLITVEKVPLYPPAGSTGFFKLLWWSLFGKKFDTKQTVELVWPEVDTIILNCPDCATPFATSERHKILSIEPLTIDIPVTCPYTKDRSFEISQGKINVLDVNNG